MAYTTINKSSLHMNTKLYTGTGATQSITGINFQPDMTWFKHRNGTSEHNIYDAVRGATKRIIPNDNSAEGTQSNGLSAFGSDGFTVVDSNATNLNNGTYASWNWKANGAGSSNTDGSITSTVSANTTSGFSIVSYTGTGANATIGHGLGSAPKMVIVKDRDNGTYAWHVYHVGVGATKTIYLNATNTPDTSSIYWNNTAPTSSVFSVGTSVTTNNSGDNFIAYCFADVQGYSKFGSYTGNGNADGTFVYTGFKPSFVMLKGSSIAEAWWMFDNKRSESNVTNDGIIANGSNTEYSNSATFKIDMLSNGFKTRDSDGSTNGSGQTYIYMAFAEAPLVGDNNVPCTAR